MLKRLKDRDVLVRDVSSVFFGLNISCAQCHRHPYMETLTQDYFYGMREFFAASYDFQGNLLDHQYVKLEEFKTKSGKMRPAGRRTPSRRAAPRRTFITFDSNINLFGLRRQPCTIDSGSDRREL